MHKRQLQADLALLLVAVFWGTTYVFTKYSLDQFQPINLISLRFTIASITLALIFLKRMRHTNLLLLKRGFLLSLMLLIAFLSMSYGLLYTSASNASFIISTTLLFVPLFERLFFKKKLGKKIWLCVLLATAGVGFLTLGDDFRLVFGWGELLSLGCAIPYAIFILMTDRFCKEHDPVLLSIWQMIFIAMISTGLSVGLETYTLPMSREGWIVILLLALPCTAFAYVIQTVAQKYTSPTHTGMILSLETLFSGIFAYFILKEVLAPRNYVGAFLLLTSVFLMEFSLDLFKPPKKPMIDS